MNKPSARNFSEGIAVPVFTTRRIFASLLHVGWALPTIPRKLAGNPHSAKRLTGPAELVGNARPTKPKTIAPVGWAYSPTIPVEMRRSFSLRLTPAGIVVFIALFVAVAATDSARAADVSQLKAEATVAYQQGDYAKSATAWQQMVKEAAANKDVAAQADAQLGLGAAYQMHGDYLFAARALNSAAELLATPNDAGRKIEWLNGCGTLCTLNPSMACFLGTAGDHADHTHCGQLVAEPRGPQSYFAEAMQLAESSGDLRLQASVHTNLGNYLAESKKFKEAIAQHAASADLAEKLNDKLLLINAQGNAAAAAAAGAKYSDTAAIAAADSTHFTERQQAKQLRADAVDLRQQCAAWTAKMLAGIDGVTDSRAKVYQLITAGLNDQQLAVSDPALAADSSKRAAESFTQAMQSAQSAGDSGGLSYASGYLGQVYESQPAEYDQAMALTRRAVFAAQQAGSTDSLYLWQWQTGRLLREHGDNDAAIAAYGRAAYTVKNIRNDIALGNGNQRSRATFRDRLGPLYYQMADLLLRRAKKLSRSGDPADALAAAESLKQARDTVELLKGAELEDYLQDECVQLYNPNQQIASVGKGVAVIYFIPLDDRIELLVSFGNTLEQFEVPIAEAKLTEQVNIFREKLVFYGTDEYKSSGGQLYDWLIRPLEGELAKHQIDTLVFVPDGALRTIPMAALYDGHAHLLEKYAVAVSPGLTLMDPSEIHRGNVKLLLVGLSEARENFAALPNVPFELRSVHDIFGDSKQLLDKQFILKSVQSEVGGQPYNIVHIASHATFGSDAKKTYLLTYDDHLTLDGLEQLIRPKQFGGADSRPVELLVLSACQTAAGDDRAALGLGGIAVKSGARSALATLWNVNDESSSLVIPEFYRQLHDHPDISKAQAMRAAQMSLMKNPNPALRHPSLWAPYLIIGNWL
jgi:CHAT domain-containing protein